MVCDEELSPSQQRNLADYLEIPVLDRTGIILDIFSERATTREGMLQVELASLKYMLPRLSSSAADLSRLGGGIGTRGPGERKLELDRRLVRKKINSLEKKLEQVEKRRKTTRKLRDLRRMPLVCLVGYTNAGKSSLMASMTGAPAYIDDRLFATLDTTTHRVALPEGGNIILGDSVGFINKLPHQLVAAFRSTLEEVRRADLLLHVADIASPGIDARIETVERVLNEISPGPRSEIMVYNKCDLLSPQALEDLLADLPAGCPVSAATGVGMEALLREIQDAVYQGNHEIHVTIPFSRGDLVNLLFENAHIMEKRNRQDGVEIVARGNPDILSRVSRELGDIYNDRE